ncbi:hypothetical protein [Sediminibacterium goheungense]|uniref:Uncharacterized protein n=1 Tax=Sediminibacterium goheungense TaxID=1086393 RepID=A0A4R6J011_9BACT|nr:hypothetical protein [Sediminibacterium goheungense]TDO28117.1 hypothetical protein BC659_0177 [Sediminibacterium goheungense]
MRIVFVLFGLLFFQGLSAQQRLEPGRMHYLTNPKPNSILYRDTLYRGSKEFMQLFYRTRDQQLIDLYEKHQSNKITGQVLGVVGSFALIFGISRVSSNDNQKGLGWGLIGGGFVATITSGALILQSQRQLYTAVTLFNQRHNKASLGIGLADKQAGLVYKF